jgi:mono/diheme cytochrome c family protein
MKKVFLLLIGIAVIAYAGYEALMYYDNNFIYGRMRETPAVRPYEHPMPIMEAGLVPFTGGEENYFVVAADELKSPLENDDPETTLKLGKTVYFTYCAQCHGKNYDGYGPVGQSFAPTPTDLRSTKVHSKSDGALFKEISYGIPGGRQPALATTISIMDRWRVVAYVKSLGLR